MVLYAGCKKAFPFVVMQHQYLIIPIQAIAAITQLRLPTIAIVVAMKLITQKVHVVKKINNNICLTGYNILQIG